MASLYSQICRHVILPLGDRVAGLRVMRHLRFYERSQYWPTERLSKERDRLLRETVETAYAEVPFYRALYDRHRVLPRDIQGVNDLSKLPIVDKAMLREAFPQRCTRRTPFNWHDYTTSGSTGNPFVVRVDDDTMSRARALMFLRTMWAGWAPGDRVMQYGMTVERGRLKATKDRLLRTTYLSAWDLSDDALDRHLELMEVTKPQFLTGYASALYLLAKRARAVGFNRTLRGVVSWASNMLPQYREEIRLAFGCPTFDSYGVGEGMQVASQCEHSTFHTFCLHTACEVVKGNAPAPPGETGEIILTRLDAGIMPLIRYAVGDLGRSPSRSSCPCGRTLPLLDGIDGRLGDCIVTPSGRNLTVEFFFGVFQHAPAPTIKTFQVVQTSANAIHVAFVPQPSFEWRHWEEIRDAILNDGDPELQITAEAVTEIANEASGKPRYVKAMLVGAEEARH